MKKISVDQVLPVYIPGRDRIYQTAVQELKSVLPGAYAEMHANSSDTGCSISLSIWKDLEKNVAQELIENGRTNLHNLSSDLDAYEITSLGNTLYLLGTTACALFQAVYEIQENVKEQGFLSMQLQLERSLTPAKRVFHQRIDHWPGTRSDIRYISHLGANTCLLVHDWDKNRNLQCYVTASEFPDAVSKQAVQENCRKLHKCIEDCLDYGIEPYLWITELPCQGGKWVKEEVREQFLNRYSPEVLSDSGTNEGKVLCFGHPRVQAYYRELIHNFLLKFPQISTFFLFGNDCAYFPEKNRIDWYAICSRIWMTVNLGFCSP